jgi:hypothetical protein
METHPNPRRRLKNAATRLVGAHAKVSQKANAAVGSASAALANAASSAASSASGGICSEGIEKKKRKSKTLAKGIWTLFMLGTVGAVLYGLLFSSVSTKMIVSNIVRNENVAAGLALYAVFFVAGGVYSFLT